MKDLEKLSPEDYLNPDNFRTGDDDRNLKYAEEQYQKGLEIGRDAVLIAIGYDSVWSARTETGPISSYEKIGHHAHTASLLRGFLDSGCTILVYRWSGPSPVMIQERNWR